MVSCALEDRAEARALARTQIALYAAQPGFTSFFDHARWAGEAATVCDAAHLGSGRMDSRTLGTRLIPDEMLDGLAAAGTPGEVVEAVSRKERQLAAQGIEELTVQVPGVALPAERTDEVLAGLMAALSRVQA